MWIGVPRTAIALLLTTVSWSASAQTAQNEQLRQVISNLKTCVRMRAPEAQANGVDTTGDAVEYLVRTCSPRVTELENVGAVPPGIFRITIDEECAAFVKRKSTP
jgi:type II secretory pathway pseudopilin PulG